MNITFLLPGDSCSGGARVTMQLGNRLVELGHTVRIAYRVAPWFSREHSVGWLRQLKYRLEGIAETHWLDSFTGKKDGFFRVEDLRFEPGDIVISTGEFTNTCLHRLDERLIKVRYCHGFIERDPVQMKAAWGGKTPTIAVSPALVEALQSYCDGAVVGVVPNGIDASDYFVEEQPRRGIGFVYHGSTLKGSEMVAPLVELLRLKFPKTPLHVFGTYPKPSILSPGEYVRYPAVSESRKIYNQCKIWLVLSRDEGFCLPMLEAMACGCAVITSRHTNARELIQDNINGYMVDYGAVEDYLDRAARLLGDESRREQMVAEGVKTVRRFTWERAAHQMETVLENLASQRNRNSTRAAPDVIQSEAVNTGRSLNTFRNLVLEMQRWNIGLPRFIRGPLRELLIKLSKAPVAGREGIEDWTLPLIAGRPVTAHDIADAPTTEFPVKNGRRVAELRCLLVTSSLDVGGMEDVVVFLARRLPFHGVHTAVLHASAQGTSDGVPRGRHGRLLISHGIEAVEYDAVSGARWLEDWKPDVISAHDAPDWVMEAAARLGIPYVETLHGMHSLFNTSPIREAGRSDGIARIIAVSDLVRRQYLDINPAFPPERIMTIPNGVDDWRRIAGDRDEVRARWGIQDEYVFISLARHCLQKNAYGLIAAFEDVAARSPEAHLVIAGRPDDAVYFNQLLHLRSTLRCRDRIRLRDHTHHPAELLTLADGFVLDSFFEGWSLASMEALHAGIPVVLSDVGGAREQIGAGEARGYLVPNPLGDPLCVNWKTIRAARYARQVNREALVAAMGSLIDERTQRLASRERLIQESSARFHPDVCLRKHAQVLADAVNRS